MLHQIIATSKFYGRPEYYNEVFESSEFNLELHEWSGDFGIEYRLLVEYSDRLYIHSFDDKCEAMQAYLSECASMPEFV
nr:MAG TPA: hypothetical protein [Caudoviricetes sp.]